MKKGIGLLALITLIFGIYQFGSRQKLLKKNKNIDLEKWVSVEPAQNNSSEIIFGISSIVSAEETWDSYKKLVKIISRTSGYEMDLMITKDYKSMRRLLESQKVDIALVCTGTYIKSLKNNQLEIIAVPQLQKNLDYQTYIIVKNNSAILEISHLKGKTFAFTDPESNTGCIIPQWIFKKKSLSENSFKKIIYTGTHDRSIRSVASGFIDAAAIDALVYHSMVKKDPGLAVKIKIIWESQAFGPPPLVVHKSLAQPKKAALKKALFAFGKNEEEKNILSDVQIRSFAEPNPDAYLEVKQIWNQME